MVAVQSKKRCSPQGLWPFVWMRGGLHRPAHPAVQAPSHAGPQANGDQGQPCGQRKDRAPRHSCAHRTASGHHSTKAHQQRADQVVAQFIF